MFVKVNEVANFEHERSGASQSEKFGNLDNISACPTLHSEWFQSLLSFVLATRFWRGLNLLD